MERSSRRRVLTVLGGSVAVGIAGCLGDEPEPADEGSEDFPSHPGDGHTPVPEGHICDGVCGMSAEKPPEWIAQLAHDDGTGAFFCSVGCMVAYAVAPTYAEGNEAPIEGVWVPEYGSADIIDGLAASYALEDDEEYESEPMALNPRPFADRADAVAYVEARENLTADDIIALEEFDLETARIYRGNRLPSPD